MVVTFLHDLEVFRNELFVCEYDTGLWERCTPRSNGTRLQNSPLHLKMTLHGGTILPPELNAGLWDNLPQVWHWTLRKSPPLLALSRAEVGIPSPGFKTNLEQWALVWQLLL